MVTESPTRSGVHAEHLRTNKILAALVPAAVTAVVYAPQLFRDSNEQFGAAVNVGWIVLLAAAAPIGAFVFNRRWPVAKTGMRALAVGLPQLAVAVILIRLDVWLEVRSGYLLAGSGEEAMSYGIGTVVAVVGGTILSLLVALAARHGARGRRRGERH